MQLQIPLCIFLFTSILGLAARAPSDKVVFLDVGQGDAILLQNNNQQLLIDGGPGATVLERLAEELPYYDKKIEVVAVTHPQQDHIEGLLHVLERYDVGLVILPHGATGSSLFESFLNSVEEKKIPYRFAWAGQKLQFHDAIVQILAPLETEQAKVIARADINNASVTTRIDMHGLSFYLSGDAEQVAEHTVVSSWDKKIMDVDIVKAGHHGSNSSTQHLLLKATTPSAAVISVGEDNRYGHPHPAVLSRLSGVPVWRTDIHGSVRFLFDKKKWYVGSYKAGEL